MLVEDFYHLLLYFLRILDDSIRLFKCQQMENHLSSSSSSWHGPSTLLTVYITLKKLALLLPISLITIAWYSDSVLAQVNKKALEKLKPVPCLRSHATHWACVEFKLANNLNKLFFVCFKLPAKKKIPSVFYSKWAHWIILSILKDSTCNATFVLSDGSSPGGGGTPKPHRILN